MTLLHLKVVVLIFTSFNISGIDGSGMARTEGSAHEWTGENNGTVDALVAATKDGDIR